MVLNEEKHWELLLDRLNIGELARDERFENAEARNSNKGLLMTILQDRLIELECAQIETVLQDTGIIFSRVSSAQQTISDPQTHANGMFMDYGDFEGEKKQLVAPPINVENAPRIKAKGAPEIGEHNIVVLEELGFSSDQIIDFKNKGVLG